MIDDKVPPLCCLGPDYFRGFCPVSEGKAFLKHLISKKKKNQDQPSTSYKNSLAVQDAAMAFVFRLLSLCFWHISTPASHQAELVFKWIGVFFPSYLLLLVQTPISLPRPLCCQYNSAWRDGRAHYRQCLHFFFFLWHSSQRDPPACGMRDFLFFFFFVQTSGSVGGETVSPQCQYFHCRLFWFGCLFYEVLSPG